MSTVELSESEAQAVVASLTGTLLSGREPESGDPIAADVPWVVYEEHDVFGADFHRRLRAATERAGSARVTAVSFYDDGEGGIAASEGLTFDVPEDADAWYDLAMETNVGVNGMSWILTDEARTWVAVTVVDVQVVAATADAASAWFDGASDALRRRDAFTSAFDRADRGEPFRRMTGWARVPPA